MTTAQRDDLASELRADFVTACADLTDARLQQFHKDSPANRLAVQVAEEQIDTILDMYLEAQ